MLASNVVTRGKCNAKKPEGKQSFASHCSRCAIRQCIGCFEVFHKIDYLTHAVDDILQCSLVSFLIKYCS